MNADRRVDHWLREEADVPAPERLLEDVFNRTEATRQVRPGWRGALDLRWRGAASGERPTWQRGLVGLTAFVLVALVGGSIGARLATGPGSGGGSVLPPSASSVGGPGGSPALLVQRSHQTCSRRGGLAILGAGSAQPSVWVTCGADSEEIVIGTDTVTSRPGLGMVATDGTSEWAIRGDSVVQLNPDRTIARSVRIGTPSAIAVAASAVWALDTRTGRLDQIGATGVDRSVVPAADGRPIALAIAAGSLWVLDQTGAQLLRLDLRDGHQVAAVPVAASATFLVSAASALYVASPLIGTITRIDPVAATATTLQPDLGRDGHIDALGGSPDALVLGSRSGFFRLDPVSAALTTGAIGPEYVAAVGVSGATGIVLTEVGQLIETALP